jgi:hypothetical protein
MHLSAWFAVVVANFSWSCLAEQLVLPLVYSTSIGYPASLNAHGQLTLDSETLLAQASQSSYSIKEALNESKEVYRVGIETNEQPFLGTVRLAGLDVTKHYEEKLRLYLNAEGQIYHVSLDAIPVKMQSDATLRTQVVAWPKPDPALDPILKPVTKAKKATEDQLAVQSTEDDLKVEEVEEEVVPKSFLQKYWIYLLPVLLVLVMTPAQEENKEAK